MKLTKKKTYKVLDLFCGCGGISEGYALAGFEIMYRRAFNDITTFFASYFVNYNSRHRISTPFFKYTHEP